MSKVMGIDAIPQKKCINPERQVYFFLLKKKKSPFNNIQVAKTTKTTFKKTHVYNRGQEVKLFISL